MSWLWWAPSIKKSKEEKKCNETHLDYRPLLINDYTHELIVSNYKQISWISVQYVLFSGLCHMLNEYQE